MLNTWDLSELTLINSQYYDSLIETGWLGQGEYQLGVLNGITYDPSTGHFYITGKNWPLIFEVDLD